jgi:hypothetical protein
MFGKLFKKQVRGTVIRASYLNQVSGEAERLSKFTVAAPLQLQDNPNGIHISLAVPPPLWAKITAAPTSGAYPWIQQVPATGGGWADGNLSTATGSPLAYNSIGVSAPTVPVGTIVRLTPSGVNDYRFSISTC